MKYLVPGIVVVALGLGIPSNVGAQSEITLLSPNPIEATINKSRLFLKRSKPATSSRAARPSLRGCAWPSR